MDNNYVRLSDEQIYKELSLKTEYVFNSKLKECMENNIYLSGQQKRALKRKIRRNLHKRNSQ